MKRLAADLVAILVLSMLATWGLAGPGGGERRPGETPMAEPVIEVSRGVQGAVGVCAAALLVFVLWRWYRERSPDTPGAALPLVVVAYGFFLAYAYRTTTTPVDGANIGGGLYLLATVPVTIVCSIIVVSMGRRNLPR